MIVNVNEKKEIVLTKLVAKEGKDSDLQGLYYLYTALDFQLGYLQGGKIWWHIEPLEKDVVVTDSEILVNNPNGEKRNAINGRYPVAHYSTKAKNTLIFIRNILEENYTNNIMLRKFFENKDTYRYEEFDFEMQINKLSYLLDNKDLALPLLKDAYLDFYLFTNLLTLVDLNDKKISRELYEPLLKDGIENGKILTLAKVFSKLRQ